MILQYLYIKHHKHLKDIAISLSGDYNIEFNEKIRSLDLNSKKVSATELFTKFDNPIHKIQGYNLLIGKNGVGKSSILELLRGEVLEDTSFWILSYDGISYDIYYSGEMPNVNHIKQNGIGKNFIKIPIDENPDYYLSRHLRIISLSYSQQSDQQQYRNVKQQRLGEPITSYIDLESLKQGLTADLKRFFHNTDFDVVFRFSKNSLEEEDFKKYFIYLKKYIAKKHPLAANDFDKVIKNNKSPIQKKLVRLYELVKKLKVDDSTLQEHVDFLRFLRKLHKSKNEEMKKSIQKIDGSLLSVIKNAFKIASQHCQLIQMDFERVSTGERLLLHLYAAYDYYSLSFNHEGEDHKSLLFLLDELEAFLHPEWCRKINAFLLFTGSKYGSFKNYQYVLTSHSPYLVSDLPREYVTSLKKNSESKIVAHTPDFSFSANIYDLMKSSFFIDSAIGEFAKVMIEEVVLYLNGQELHPFTAMTEEKVNYIIENIDDPVLERLLSTRLEVYKLNNKKFRSV